MSLFPLGSLSKESVTNTSRNLVLTLLRICYQARLTGVIYENLKIPKKRNKPLRLRVALKAA